MGCFSTCFGTCKPTRPRRRRSLKTHPSLLYHLQIHQSVEDLNVTLLIEEELEEQQEEQIDKVENSSDLSPDTSDEKGESANLSGRKKVTFDLNIKVYENLSREEELIEEQSVDEIRAESQCGSESSFSSLFSYPLDHRYQNCTHSDDEFDDILSFDESEIDEFFDDDYDDCDCDCDCGEEVESQVKYETQGVVQEQSSESLFSLSVDSRKHNLGTGGADKEMMKAVPPIDSNSECDGRNYADSVLNPVENLTQWKVIRKKSRLASEVQATENLNSDQDFGFSVRKEGLQKEIGVDTSLSTWLMGSEHGIVKRSNSRNSSVSVGNVSADRKSVSPNKFEDRPILGALTLEEIRQMSAASKPRKSPSRRSPDDFPIIGSVGSYWSHTGQTNNSGSSTKSTKSRYGESAEVIWDSTPFETRLDKALEKEADCGEALAV